MNNKVAPTPPPGLHIETRCIEQIPLDERHGKAWHLAPFWFTGNSVLTTLVAGFVGPAMGLGVRHSIIAILIGVGLGTLCLALHANQGPRLGLPQMIQSRTQFGRRGATLPLLAAIFVYLGLNVFNTVLATDAISSLLPGPDARWFAVLLGAAMLMAMAGHDLLLSVQRWLTYLLIGVFGVLSLAALLLLEADTAQRSIAFYWPAFFVQLAAAAGYQLGYTVYASDYSRYLPASTPARSVIVWTFLGAAGAACWLMSLGALLASAIHGPDAIASLQQLGNRFLPGFGSFAVLASVPALVGIMALNCYGAALAGISALSGFIALQPGLRARLVGIALAALCSYGISLWLPTGYLDSFNAFLLLMLYFLIPWSAINLTDFYLLRRHSPTPERNWAWPGLLAYLGGWLGMLPFLSLGLYEGAMVEVLDGADIAFLVGFAVSALLYAALMRLDAGWRVPASPARHDSFHR
ncbi:cytosine permease [Pseudomonas sp. SDI]|uniref:purine-cytosine permease family protein n=1 Tax=Pseudomonas sp. SDI TaxID=2170734 RepID=UPI000DE686D3|nr:cytosine permease [Pseudomonas sp. SDI]PWB30373.1 cytosine permease [Pseudomonas sp. SDI]